MFKRSHGFQLYTKKDTNHVLFYDKNMAVTFTSRVHFMVEDTY